jgi:hypothetical protein
VAIGLAGSPSTRAEFAAGTGSAPVRTPPLRPGYSARYSVTIVSQRSLTSPRAEIDCPVALDD